MQLKQNKEIQLMLKYFTSRWSRGGVFQYTGCVIYKHIKPVAVGAETVPNLVVACCLQQQYTYLFRQCKSMLQ